MELRHPPRLIYDAGRVSGLARDYIDRLPMSAAERAQVLGELGSVPLSDARATRRIHAWLSGDTHGDAHPIQSVEARVALALQPEHDTDATSGEMHREGMWRTAPPLARTSMAPRRWPWGQRSSRAKSDPWRRKRNVAVDQERRRASSPSELNRRSRWVGSARRVGLTVLVLLQTALGTQFMSSVLPYNGTQPLEIAILVFFAALMCWVSIGFWMAVAGFVLLLFGKDRYSISATSAGEAPIDAAARTAVVMPICNEDVPRVFAGLRATFESVQRAGASDRFDFFVLSDSSDVDTRVAETEAWVKLCRESGGFGRIFYRWRRHRIKRKSGNLADFCRRWGRNYRYMVVLDADSVMSGQCLTKLVRLMEANPEAGIIQTAPRAAGHSTLYARIQQFANRVYGPVFVAGLHFFQLGEAYYWGHNAIIRVAPFMQHCALGKIPGKGSLSGEIMSHDFVEAALMRRAGWRVWIAYDLEGSYEEMPPNLIDELKRDRRWCQGNLINTRMVLANGMHPAHRAVFAMGVMAYASAPLWFTFLMLSTALLAVHVLIPPQYFSQPAQLFPLWPQWRPELGVALYFVTAALLFLPKVLGATLIAVKGAQEFGGVLRLVASVIAELLFSMLLAPIRMLFHTQFVLTVLFGLKTAWKSPPREDSETYWRDALRHHGLHSLFGLAWAGVVYWLNVSFLWWLLPVVGALILSIPLSVYSSRIAPGRATRARKYFLIPEEADPPLELQRTKQLTQASPEPAGFKEAVFDPLINALMCVSAGLHRASAARRDANREKRLAAAVALGPKVLSPADKGALLRDAVALSEQHLRVWSSKVAREAWFSDRRFISDAESSMTSEDAVPETRASRLARDPVLQQRSGGSKEVFVNKKAH